MHLQQGQVYAYNYANMPSEEEISPIKDHQLSPGLFFCSLKCTRASNPSCRPFKSAPLRARKKKKKLLKETDCNHFVMSNLFKWKL